MATTSPSLASITNYYKILINQVPSATQLADEALRVDLSSTSLAESLKDIYNSPSRDASYSNELAEAFFVIFGRAPDYASYVGGMDYLRSGKSFSSLMDMALATAGNRLSTSGLASNADFLSAAYSLLTNGIAPPVDALKVYSTMLDNGIVTRGQLLSAALTSADPVFHGGREKDVQTSLLFLAAASQEASTVVLQTASGNLFSDIQFALTEGGFSATSGKPYFIRPTTTSTEMSLQGELTGNLILDLQTGTYTLGGTSLFKSLYSIDGGFDAGLVSFSGLYTDGITSLDASTVTGKGTLTITGKNGAGNYHLTAPNTGSALTGADGNDILIGGFAADRLIATDGTDTLTGGAGADTFVFAQAKYYETKTCLTAITDFGNGKDVLDFSSLLGNAAPKTSTIAPILATSVTATVLGNGGVALVENNGVWVSGKTALHASPQDIVKLYGTGGTAVFLNPTASSTNVILTADSTNGADVWLVSNVVNVTTIDSTEVSLVGRITGDWNLMLNSSLPTVG